MADETEPECKTISQYMLYKLDRTLAIGGIIVIALLAIWLGKTDSSNIVMAGISGLVGYVGGRSGK